MINLVKEKADRDTDIKTETYMQQLSEIIVARDKNGMTPFHHACIPSYLEESKKKASRQGTGLPPLIPLSGSKT